MHTSRMLPVTLSLLVLSTAGCGGGGAADQPEVGTVTGVVKLDGKPLPDADVTFQPEKGRQSNGKTTDDGTYELVYTAKLKGAKIGKHTVRISTAATGVEKVPDVYNTKSTLERVVTQGSQTINFDDLDSKQGKIVQPPPEEGEGC